MDEKRIKTNYLESAGIVAAVLAVPASWMAWHWTGIQAPALGTYWCVFGLPTEPFLSLLFKVDLPSLAAWLQEHPALGANLIWHTEIALMAAGAVAGSVAWKFGWHEVRLIRKFQVGGPKLSEDTREAAAEFNPPVNDAAGGLMIHPCGVRLLRARLVAQVLTVAGSRRGKSVSMSVAIRDALRQRQRSLINDPKAEWLPFLELPQDTIIFAPQDARSVGFSPASNVRSVLDLHQLAAAFVAPASGDNAFFSDAARDVMVGILIRLQQTRPGAWSYGNIVDCLDMLAARPAEFCAEVNTAYPAAGAYVAALAAGGGAIKTAETIRAQLMASCVPLRILARAFAGKETFDFRAWLQNPDHPVRCVILMPSEDYSQLTAAAFQPVFAMIANTVISGLPDSLDPARAVNLFLDEFNTLPAMGETMIKFARLAGSKNVALFVALQDCPSDLIVSQFRDQPRPEAAAESLLANFSTTFLFGSGALASQKWCSEKIGNGQFEIVARGKSIDATGKFGTSESASLLTEPLMTPEQIDSELGNTGRGVRGVITGGRKRYKLTWPYWAKPKPLRPDSEPAEWTTEYERYIAEQDHAEVERNRLLPAARAELAALGIDAAKPAAEARKKLVIELGARS